ncbi:hypothetical protein ACFXBB_34255 [Streptomyces scopuliridis]
MRLQWVWLGPLWRVPYVPTIGPVRPGGPAPNLLFEDVLSVVGTGRFLL